MEIQEDKYRHRQTYIDTDRHRQTQTCLHGVLADHDDLSVVPGQPVGDDVTFYHGAFLTFSYVVDLRGENDKIEKVGIEVGGR